MKLCGTVNRISFFLLNYGTGYIQCHERSADTTSEIGTRWRLKDTRKDLAKEYGEE